MLLSAKQDNLFIPFPRPTALSWKLVTHFAGVISSSAFQLSPNTYRYQNGRGMLKGLGVALHWGEMRADSLTPIMSLETKLHHSSAAASFILYNAFTS